VVKMAPDGASAAAGGTTIQRGKAAAAASVSQRTGVLILFRLMDLSQGVVARKDEIGTSRPRVERVVGSIRTAEACA